MIAYDSEIIYKNMERLKKCFPHLNKFPFTYNPSSESKHRASNIFLNIASRYKELAYPEHHTWKYCIPIVPALNLDGRVVDLGIHLDDEWLTKKKDNIYEGISSNIVYSTEDYDYGSGPVDIGNIYKKRLMLELYELKIFSRQDLLNQFDKYNILMPFFHSELDGFHLKNFVGDE